MSPRHALLGLGAWTALACSGCGAEERPQTDRDAAEGERPNDGVPFVADGTQVADDKQVADDTRVYPVEADVPVEPSGLAMMDGALLAVSDEEDATIFRITVGAGRARMEPWLTFEAPEGSPSDLDLEGIAVCGDRIFVVSETADDVLEVDSSGQTRWIGADVARTGLAAGLMGTPGAGLEGVTCDGPDGLVVAAEREPRALLWIDLQARRVRAIQRFDLEDVLASPDCVDFSDVALEDGRLFALYRYGDQIVQVLGEPPDATLVPIADFSRIAVDPRYRFAGTRFGLAEGLAMDEQNFYVIVDNNDLARAADPSDSRPLLLVIPRR